MKQYKWKYMSEPMLKEMDELLKGEHGATLTVWSMECGNAGVKGFLNGIVKGTVLGVVGAAVIAGGVTIVDKIKQKRLEKAIEDFGESIKNDVDI